jgi:hypothetical protein
MRALEAAAFSGGELPRRLLRVTMGDHPAHTERHNARRRASARSAAEAPATL